MFQGQVQFSRGSNKDRNFIRGPLREFIRAAGERLDDCLVRLDTSHAEDGASAGVARTKISPRRSRPYAKSAVVTRRCWLSLTGENHSSLTDPDSRAMAAQTKVGGDYNIQVAVDENKMIVERAVTKQVVDMSLLTQIAEPARDILGAKRSSRRRPWLLQDRGHSSLREGGLHVARSQPQRGSAVREGFFRKDEFRYDAGRDGYVCPAGQLPTPIRHGRLRDFAKVDYGN